MVVSIVILVCLGMMIVETQTEVLRRTIDNFIYDNENHYLPCAKLPTEAEVIAIVQQHQDIIQAIEQVNPGLVGVDIETSTCPGKADLVKETLDFRVEPKFVGTLKGQGDATKRSGITVSVLVTGTFSSPKFAPDLEDLLKQSLEQGIPESSQLKEILKDKDKKKELKESLEEQTKDLLKSFSF